MTTNEDLRLEALRIAAQQYKTESSAEDTVRAADLYLKFLSGSGGVEEAIAASPNEFSILTDVVGEIVNAEAKFGKQYAVPDGAGDPVTFLSSMRDSLPLTREHGVSLGTICYLAREQTKLHAQNDALTWRDILLEEVFEAVSEDSDSGLRAELVQVAAVAVRWIDALDQRGES